MVYTGSHELLGFNPCGARVVGTGGWDWGADKTATSETGRSACQQQLDKRGGTLVEGAFSLQQGSTPPVLQVRKCRLRDVESLTRGHTAKIPPAQGWSPLQTPCFLGLTWHLAQSQSSVNIYCSNTESKTETLTGLTASQMPSPTHVASVLNKYLFPRC